MYSALLTFSESLYETFAALCNLTSLNVVGFWPSPGKISGVLLSSLIGTEESWGLNSGTVILSSGTLGNTPSIELDESLVLSSGSLSPSTK